MWKQFPDEGVLGRQGPPRTRPARERGSGDRPWILPPCAEGPGLDPLSRPNVSTAASATSDRAARRDRFPWKRSRQSPSTAFPMWLRYVFKRKLTQDWPKIRPLKR
jgi:hypothetical protein